MRRAQQMHSTRSERRRWHKFNGGNENPSRTHVWIHCKTRLVFFWHKVPWGRAVFCFIHACLSNSTYSIFPQNTCPPPVDALGWCSSVYKVQIHLLCIYSVFFASISWSCFLLHLNNFPLLCTNRLGILLLLF